jgi:hypothetical protein
VSEARRSNQRRRRSGSLVAPFHRVGRGLRVFMSDIGVALRDPTIPPATPTLRDYPIGRP